MAGLKTGVTLWSFGPYHTFEEFQRNLDLACEVGAQAVQPWCVDYAADSPCALDPDRCTGSQRQAVGKAIAQRGLAISGWCAQLMGTQGPTDFGGFGTPQGLRGRIEKTKRAIEFAVELGAPIVTTHVGRIPEDPKHPDYQLFLTSVAEVVQHAEKIGGIFALETGQESAQCLMHFLGDLCSPAAKCNYDPANMLDWGTVDGVRILAPYIVHAHAKDLDPTTGKATLGCGRVPWTEYLAAMQAIGYNGWHAVEDETGDNVVESIRTGIEFLRQF